MQFTIKQLWWKGPVVIRGMPVVYYFVVIHENKRIQKVWEIDRNPITHTDEMAVEVETKEVKLLDKSGSFPPEHPLNPLKELPLFHRTLDTGTCEIITKSEDFWRFRFQGKKLKGIFVMQRRDPKAPMWIWRHAELPKPKETRIPVVPFVLHRHYNSIPTHYDIRLLWGPQLLEFFFVKNPLEMKPDEQSISYRKYCPDLSWFILKGNNVKMLIAGKETFVDVLDKGMATVPIHDEDGTLLSLNGDSLSGIFQYKEKEKLIIKLKADALKERDLAPVFPSGKILGKPIKPQVISKYFSKPIIISKNFVFITNPDRTTLGDIDVIAQFPRLELPNNVEDKSRDELISIISQMKSSLISMYDWLIRPVFFRLSRAILANPELSRRIHYTSDDRGPFTDFLPLFDLALIPSKEEKIIRMTKQFVESKIRESFRWARPFRIEDAPEGLLIRGQALFPTCSLNQRCYSRKELIRLAGGAKNKPIMINHGEPPYQNLEIGKILDAEVEDDALEFIGVITDPEWIEKIKSLPESQRKLSVGAEYRELNILPSGREEPKGLVLDEISIIIPPDKPGVPDAWYELKLDGWH